MDESLSDDAFDAAILESRSLLSARRSDLESIQKQIRASEQEIVREQAVLENILKRHKSAKTKTRFYDKKLQQMLMTGDELKEEIKTLSNGQFAAWRRALNTFLGVIVFAIVCGCLILFLGWQTSGTSAADIQTLAVTYAIMGLILSVYSVGLLCWQAEPRTKHQKTGRQWFELVFVLGVGILGAVSTVVGYFLAAPEQATGLYTWVRDLF